MTVSLSWFGVSTFRLDIDGRMVFLDCFVDRAPEAPDVGLKSDEIEQADFVLLGHSHFDHALGAETIARNTGAVVVGSYESARIMADDGVSESQLLPVSGGETVDLGDDVRVRVFPGLHSCIWAPGSRDASACLTGDLDLPLQGRLRRQVEKFAAREAGAPAHSRDHIPHVRGDGGALVYLIETPEGSIWWNDTSGYWSWVVDAVNPDVAIVAAAGRGNIDGEPVQGSLAQFVGSQVERLAPRSVILCHHDNWNPPLTKEMDLEPIVFEIDQRTDKSVEVISLAYSDPIKVRFS